VQPIPGANSLNAVGCASTTCVAVDSAGNGFVSSPVPSSTTPPTITGNPTVGTTLHTSSGTWEADAALSYGYQWQRCTRNSCDNIRGATSSSYKITATDLNARLRVVVGAADRAGVGFAISASVGPVSPSIAQIKSWLRKLLVPPRRAARIRTILRTGGCTLSFSALTSGTLRVAWSLAPQRAHVSSSGRHAEATNRQPVLVATGTASPIGGSKVKLKLKLTRAGRRLLEHSKHIKLTATGQFKAHGDPRLTVRRGVRLASS
jgi:hypothetical protein